MKVGDLVIDDGVGIVIGFLTSASIHYAIVWISGEELQYPIDDLMEVISESLPETMVSVYHCNCCLCK